MSNMDRRSFIRALACLSIGTAALPEQLDMLTLYYEANTPHTTGRLLALDELWASGLATCSTPVTLQIYSDAEIPLNLGYNAFGGILRWAAGVDQKIVRPPGVLGWRISPFLGSHITPIQVGFIGSDLKRRYLQLDKPEGVIE